MAKLTAGTTSSVTTNQPPAAQPTGLATERTRNQTAKTAVPDTQTHLQTEAQKQPQPGGKNRSPQSPNPPLPLQIRDSTTHNL